MTSFSSDVVAILAHMFISNEQRPTISPDGSHRKCRSVVPLGYPPRGTTLRATWFAHSSHIMTKELMKSGSKSDHVEIQKHVPRRKKVFIRNIPAGATSKIQPLDVFYFNVMKRFMKRITSFAQVHDIDYKVYQRDNLLKTLQFNHPDFADFVKYAWHSAGYIDRPPPLKNKDSPSQNFFSRVVLGFIAGALGSTGNIAIDVAKSRIQGPQPNAPEHKYHTTIQTMQLIYKEEGFRALHKGLSAKSLRLGPGGALMLVIYENAYEWLKKNA